MAELMNVSTEAILVELERRGAGQRVEVGRYKDYSLRRKYAEGREEINGEVLILRGDKMV